ncbi:MAG TPA: DUF1579 domain-containing protein [Ferruginibacter sp.]|nr:DUF1579 domain-containing protein [Ferruginibacter sp.]
MKQTALLFIAATMLLFSCNNSGDNKSSSTDTSAKKDAVKMDNNNDGGKMAPLNPMDDIHKMIASWDGVWTSEVTMWEKPDAPPKKSTGSCENKMVLGGRYQESVHHGTFDSMPFEGHSTLAYDNNKKIFQSTWIDNMGTGIMIMSGPWDAATKTSTMKGKELDPATGKEGDYRETFQVIDDNTQMMAMYGPGPDGKEWKMMEIKFTRKK